VRLTAAAQDVRVRVLLIDDKATLVRLLGRALREEGWEVDHAVPGEDAVQLARKGGYDVVVFDEVLPDQDVVSVCDRLGAGATQMRLLMLSEGGDPSACVAALDAGADDYMAKPCVLEELLARVHALARRSQASSDRSLTWCASPLVLDARTDEAPWRPS
jgi:two-component system OmpR family response regulator